MRSHITYDWRQVLPSNCFRLIQHVSHLHELCTYGVEDGWDKTNENAPSCNPEVLKEYSYRLLSVPRVVFGSDRNGFAFVEGVTCPQSGQQVKRTAFVHSFNMTILTAFEIIVYLRALVHTDWILIEKKLTSHPTYNIVRTRRDPAFLSLSPSCPQCNSSSYITRGSIPRWIISSGISFSARQ